MSQDSDLVHASSLPPLLVKSNCVISKENSGIISPLFPTLFGPIQSPSHYLNYTSVASWYESPMWQLHDFYVDCNGTYLHPMFWDKVNDSFDLPARNKQSKVNLLYQLLQALLITSTRIQMKDFKYKHWLLMKHTFRRELIILAQPNSPKEQEQASTKCTRISLQTHNAHLPVRKDNIGLDGLTFCQLDHINTIFSSSIH